MSFSLSGIVVLLCYESLILKGKALHFLDLRFRPLYRPKHDNYESRKEYDERDDDYLDIRKVRQGYLFDDATPCWDVFLPRLCRYAMIAMTSVSLTDSSDGS